MNYFIAECKRIVVSKRLMFAWMIALGVFAFIALFTKGEQGLYYFGYLNALLALAFFVVPFVFLGFLNKPLGVRRQVLAKGKSMPALIFSDVLVYAVVVLISYLVLGAIALGLGYCLYGPDPLLALGAQENAMTQNFNNLLEGIKFALIIDVLLGLVGVVLLHLWDKIGLVIYAVWCIIVPQLSLFLLAKGVISLEGVMALFPMTMFLKQAESAWSLPSLFALALAVQAVAAMLFFLWGFLFKKFR